MLLLTSLLEKREGRRDGRRENVGGCGQGEGRIRREETGAKKGRACLYKEVECRGREKREEDLCDRVPV